MPVRFLTVTDVTEVLNLSIGTVYELLRSGELRGIQIGERRQWRIAQDDLDAYITRLYEQTQSRTRPSATAPANDEAL